MQPLIFCPSIKSFHVPFIHVFFHGACAMKGIVHNYYFVIVSSIPCILLMNNWITQGIFHCLRLRHTNKLCSIDLEECPCVLCMPMKKSIFWLPWRCCNCIGHSYISGFRTSIFIIPNDLLNFQLHHHLRWNEHLLLESSLLLAFISWSFEKNQYSSKHTHDDNKNP